MLISLKRLNHSLSTVSKGKTLLNINTSRPVKLYTDPKDKLQLDNILVMTGNNEYVAHVAPGTIVVVGSLDLGRKVFTIDDSGEVARNADIYIVGTRGDSIESIYEIPKSYSRTANPITDLNKITLAILSLAGVVDKDNDSLIKNQKMYNLYPIKNIKVRIAPVPTGEKFSINIWGPTITIDPTMTQEECVSIFGSHGLHIDIDPALKEPRLDVILSSFNLPSPLLKFLYGGDPNNEDVKSDQ